MSLLLVFGGIDNDVHRFHCESIDVAYRLMESIEDDYAVKIQWWVMLRNFL